MTGLHGSYGPQPPLPDAGDGACCWGALNGGPDSCTCWEPVYDLAQAAVVPGEPATRDLMCSSCAYRPGSPERTGDESYAGDQDELDRLAAGGTPFFCHAGIRVPVAWRHPSGVTIPAHPGGYDPPILAGVPYKADGSPADRCAGWDARRRALETQHDRIRTATATR